jgi:arginyl-tRNA synthetase
MTLIPDMISQEVERVLGSPALVRPADPKFGDYQANGVMAVAKQQNRNPREMAESVISQLQLDRICEPPTVAGPGFINFRLKTACVADHVNQAARDGRHGVPMTVSPRTVVIDYCGVNIAKPMHVGHIRSTIIGDCLARVLGFLGHKAITDNHVGDWGTQFGMLLLGWKQFRDEKTVTADPIGELLRLYKLVSAREDLRDAAKAELVKLQQGDPDNTAIWQRFIALSQREFDKIYQRLGVRFDHVLGESFYNNALPGVVDDLKTRGIAVLSEGAWCVFLNEPGLPKTPFIIQKSDGAYNYATTDLATLKYRVEHFHADEILYVVGAPQADHFKQLFATARKWGYDNVDLRHVAFGSVLGEDGKLLRTRSGDSIQLGDLLDEAELRALAVVTEKNPELSEDVRRHIARVVGIGAVKYADLSQNRTTDYVFSWDKMLAMTGNTAPYTQYAYVRVQSIFRKAGAAPGNAPIALGEPAEIDLAKHILRFGETLRSVVDDDKPNWLTGYLFDLAGKFSAFYDQCPVLESDEPIRSSRLTLCRLTADVMKRGLNLLGIDVIEQM